MEALIMTNADEKIIRGIFSEEITKAVRSLPCNIHGEKIAVMDSKLTNHIANGKEQKKFNIDIWKVVLTVITTVILVLQFVDKMR